MAMPAPERSGIEALSRGAPHVTFVDSDRRATALVEANLSHCGVKERYAIIRVDFARLASRLEAATRGFDIIFLDPPYGAEEHGVGARQRPPDSRRPTRA